MLLPLNVLRNTNTSEYCKLCAKAKECAGLIGNVISCQLPPRVSHVPLQPLRLGVKSFEPMQACLSKIRNPHSNTEYVFHVFLCHTSFSVPTPDGFLQTVQSI